MADNTVLGFRFGGDTIAADDIAGVKHQRLKLAQGADGVAADVSSAAPLNVTMANAALTAAVHAITATVNSSAMQDGLTAVTPKTAIINSLSGDITVVAAVAGKKIRVLLVNIMGASSSQRTIRFEDGAGGTALTGLFLLASNADTATVKQGTLNMPFNPVGWFETSVNTLLNLEVESGLSIRGYLVYIEVV